MTMISSISPRDLPVQPAGSANNALDQTAFLRLMTTQLKAQDPFNPMDNQAMVAQMAQFSSVSGIAEMNASLRGIADQMATQTALLDQIRIDTAPASPPTPPQS
jgi:flagellar basal-body rod modification protein FlgD